MDFFSAQRRARRASRRMVVLFLLAVAAMVAAVDAIVLLLGGGLLPSRFSGAAPSVVPLLALVSVGVAAMIGIASLWRTLSLAQGGSVVARDMGATPVSPDTGRPEWRRLRNVVEEVAIASGVPVPEIWVMEQESAINAFAAGYAPADAAICVTQGCLDKLSRDELQGVIAHEFSHVLNGDMRLNIRLLGLLFGILALGIAGRLLLRVAGRTRGRRDSGLVWLLVLGLGLLAVGYIGFFLGRVIQAATSRARETLADASAVQFTRQTEGLAGALKKIGALGAGSHLQARDTTQVAHMLFGEGAPGAAWLATHPPLVQRIRALEPGFDPVDLERIAGAWARRAAPGGREAAADDAERDVPAAALLLATAAAGLGDPDRRVRVTSAGITGQVGAPNAADFNLAATLHALVPPPLAAAAHEPRQAPALVLAMVLAPAGELRERQLQLVRQRLGHELATPMPALEAGLRGLHAQLRLPLAAMSFPTLRRLPRPRLERLVATLDALAHADGEVDLHEYCLAHLLRVQVVEALDPALRSAPSRLRLHARRRDAVDLFAIVARHGNEDADMARRAFLAACAEAFPGAALKYAPPRDWQRALDAALGRLDRVAPAGKELLVAGLTRAIRHDGWVSIPEAELLRTICAALHCPLPPLLDAPEPGA